MLNGSYITDKYIDIYNGQYLASEDEFSPSSNHNHLRITNNISQRFNTTISFFAYNWPPLLSYYQSKYSNESSLYGPFYFILKELANKLNARLELIPYQELGDIALAVIDEVRYPKLIPLVPTWTGNKFFKMNQALGPIGTLEFDHIFYVKREIAHLKSVSLLQIFDTKYWLCFICFLLVLLMTHLIFDTKTWTLGKMEKIQLVLNRFEFYFTSTFTIGTIASLDLFLGKNNVRRILTLSWFSIIFFLSRYFSGDMFERMSRVVPDDVIDSWHDLCKKDISLFAITMDEESFREDFENSQMSACVDQKRLTCIIPMYYKTMDQSERVDFISKLDKGEMAIITEKWQLIMNGKSIREESRKLGKKSMYHVSEEAGTIMPYYVSFIRLEDHEVKIANILVNQLIQSGIYSKWSQDSIFFSLGFVNQEVHKMEYKSIRLNQLESLIGTVRNGSILSLIAVVMEVVFGIYFKLL